MESTSQNGHIRVKVPRWVSVFVANFYLKFKQIQSNRFKEMLEELHRSSNFLVAQR